MKLESNGILIGLRPFGERDSVARVFTYDFGVMCGMMRAAQIAKKNRPLVGQVGAVAWNARLDSQLGMFHWDAEKNLAAPIMMSPDGLVLMNSAFALIAALLPERERYNALYSQTLDLMRDLAAGGASASYLTWEINLLRELGYALDLTHCSGCGRRDALEFLSPRTGRAVCTSCAAPYINKLYKLPLNLNITLRFIERVCMAQGVDVPPARRFVCGAR